MIVASVVLPSPGGPNSSTWSSASPRDFAASSAIASCSFAFVCPMNSLSRVGRSFSSNAASSSTRPAETSRSASSFDRVFRSIFDLFFECSAKSTEAIVRRSYTRSNRHSLTRIALIP